MLDHSDAALVLLDQISTLKRREAEICEQFAAVPQVDYIGAKTKIESLNTQLLAECIDERLIEFYDKQQKRRVGAWEDHSRKATFSGR